VIVLVQLRASAIRIVASSGSAVAWMPPQEFASFIAGETQKWAHIIPAMGISLED